MVVPVVTSHNRMVLSELPDPICEPSGLKAAINTESECPNRGSLIWLPDLVSHRRIEVSLLVVTIFNPFGLKATHKTVAP